MYHHRLTGELSGALADAADGKIPPEDARESLRERLDGELLAAQLLIKHNVLIDPLDGRSRAQIAADLGLAASSELEIEQVIGLPDASPGDQFAEPQ